MDLNKSHPPLPDGYPDSTVATPPSRSRSSTHGARYERWCTTREHQNNRITTYHGFAKHEKEHENYYVFLPKGPIESTRWGQQQCALCEEIDPDREHLQHHNILKYDGWLGKPVTRSRRVNFEELLRRHKTSNDKIKELADKWRAVREKKAYSCGFCITTFRTLSDRTSHIDREHYAKGKTMTEWNDTFVIKGLLLQPEVKEVCLKLFSVDPTIAETEISWPPSVIEDLQLRLELREETPYDLAVDAFRQADNRGVLPPRSTVASGLRSRSDTAGQTRILPSAQAPATFEKVTTAEPFQSPNQESFSIERAEVHHQAHSASQKTMESSLVSVSPPSSDLRLLGTSSGFPDWINNPTASTVSDPGLMYNTADNAYETAPISPTSRIAPDNPLFDQPNYVEVNEMNSLENSYLKWSMPCFNAVQTPSLSVPASEVASSGATHVGLYHDHVTQPSLEPSTEVQLPKRKLSEKSAQEANLKAPTQAPVSKYSQHYSTHSSGPEYMMHEPC